MAWKMCIGTEIGVRGLYITVLCICACVVCTSEYTGSVEKMVFQSLDKSFYNSLRLNCDGGVLENLPPWREDFTPEAIHLFRCQVPKQTFKTSWQALGIDTTKLIYIILEDTPNGTPLLESHFSALPIHWFKVTTDAFDKYKVKSFTQDVFYNVYDRGYDRGSDIRRRVNANEDKFDKTIYYQFPIPDRTLSPRPPLQLTRAQELNIYCHLTQMPLEQQPTQPRPLTVAYVRLESCPPPQRSYAAALNAANINTTTIETLHIDSHEHKLLLSQLEGLPIKYLIFQASSAQTLHDFQMDLDAMDETLVELSVSGVILHKLVPSQLIRVTLQFGKSAGEWGECAQLQRINMRDWRIPPAKGIRDGWLSHCPRLTNLSMIQPTVDEAQYALRGASALTSLQINDFRMRYLSEELLKDSPRLRYLDLSDSWLSSIEKRAFAGLKELVFVSLANNAFSAFQSGTLRHVMVGAVHLKTLDLSNNKLLDFCSFLEKGHKTLNKNLPHVEKLLLANTATTTLCFRYWISLRHIDVSDSKLKKLTVGEIPSNTTSKVVVIATNNPVESIDCYNCEKTLNATIVGDFSLDCDCRLGEMTRNLSQMPNLSIEGAFCKKDKRGPHQHLALASATRQDCHKKECGPCYRKVCSPCTCRVNLNFTEEEADCHAKDLITLPGFSSRVTTVLVSSNRFRSLNKLKLHPRLSFIDLRYNSISHLGEKSSAALFSNGRRVALFGNAMACSCQTLSWLQTLLLHQSQVVDYNNLTCAGGARVADISLEALCFEPFNTWMPLAVSAVAVAAALAAFVLIRRYQRSLKLFLFTRGWCLSCIREQELDEDFEFDAFLSFCHADDEFVTEKLVPGLSEYKLCVHYRNWEAGGWIPAQITHSVHHSRRTIVVVSPNFLESQWGLLEFRTAHAISLEERRARIIVVIVDDVLSHPRLDAELSTYLKTNTYVKWGDPWFFQKLRYALPHVPAADSLPAHEDMDQLRNAIQLYSRG